MTTTSDLRHSTASGSGGDSSRDDDFELLTVAEVAARLKVSKSWVYEHTRSRATPRQERLPHVKLGKYLRFDARRVREFLANRTRTT